MHEPAATNLEKRVVYCVALAAFVFQFEAFLVNVSLPEMARELMTTSTAVSFVIMTYLLAASISFIPAGRLGARYGLRRVFLTGCMLAALGTLASGLSPNLPLLCLSRLIQGVGTGTMVAIAYAMIPFWVDRRRMGWGYGMLSLGAGLGMLTGMPVGGLLSFYLSWHWLFLSTFPAFIALLWFGYKHLPTWDRARTDTSKHLPLDWIGLTLSSLMISLFVLSISLGSENGWRSPFILGLMIACIAVTILLWWRARNGSRLIDQALLRSPGFLSALFTLFLFQFVNGGVRFLMPFYLELGLGLSVLSSSVLLLLFPIGFSSTSAWAGRLSDRIRAEPLVQASLIFSALLCAIFAIMLDRKEILVFSIFILIFGFLTAMFSPSNNRRIMQSAAPDCKQEASALLPVTLNMGNMIGISTFDTIFSLGFPTTSTLALEEIAKIEQANSLLFLGLIYSFIFASLVLLFAAIADKWANSPTYNQHRD